MFVLLGTIQDTEDNLEENHQLSVFVPLTTEDEQDVGIYTMESVARSSTPNPPSFSDLSFNSGKA